MASPVPHVLVTGGSGYLAQHLISRFLPAVKAGEIRLGYTYQGESPPLAKVLSPDADIWSGRAELEDAASLEYVFKIFQPTILIHAAAMSSPAGCENNPLKAMAINSPEILLDTLTKVGLGDSTLIIFLSTDQVFSGEGGTPLYRETDDAIPVNVYGRSKLAFEQLLAGKWCKYIILRSSNMIGEPSPYLPQSKFLQWLDEKLKVASSSSPPAPLELFEDEIRSFVYVGDVVDTITGIVKRASSSSFSPKEIFHMGGIQHLSRVDLAKEVAIKRGYLPTPSNEELVKQIIVPIKRSSMNLGFTSPLVISMNSSKLQSSDLGFRPKTMKEALDLIY